MTVRASLVSGVPAVTVISAVRSAVLSPYSVQVTVIVVAVIDDRTPVGIGHGRKGIHIGVDRNGSGLRILGHEGQRFGRGLHIGVGIDAPSARPGLPAVPSEAVIVSVV